MVGALGLMRPAAVKGVQRNAEGSGNDAQRLDDSNNACRGNGAYADEAHVVAVDLGRIHCGDGRGSGIDGQVHVTAEKPDHRHEYEVGQNATGAEDHGAAQAHYVAEAEDESDGVKVEDHATAVGERAHYGDELEIKIFVPDVKCGYEEVIERGDACGLQQQLGL